MPSPAAPLTIERVLEISRRIGADLQLGYHKAVEALLEEIRLVSGAHTCQLVEWDEQGERITESRSTPDRRPSVSTTGLTTSILSASGDHVVAEIRLLVDPGAEAADDAGTFSAFLVSGLASLVTLEIARNEANRHARESAAAARRTMAAVRVTEDEIGNSIGVVLAWLRLAEDRGPEGMEPNGLSTSVRRLEEVQSSVARLLAHTQAEAIGRHAVDRVDATALVGDSKPYLADGRVWIVANRTELQALLTLVPPIFGDTPRWTETTWSLPVAATTRITSDLAIAIAASGGSIAVGAGGTSVSWHRIADARRAAR